MTLVNWRYVLQKGLCQEQFGPLNWSKREAGVRRSFLAVCGLPLEVVSSPHWRHFNRAECKFMSA